MPHPSTASGEPIEISRLALQSSAPPEASISDVKHLASYNWIEAPTPTIAVPGCPAEWVPRRKPRRVQRTTGLIYLSQNAARHPDSPLEPLFRALYIENPSFDISSVDVAADRNVLWKLLAFIRPTLTYAGLEEFTIHVELTAQTALFSRGGDTPTYEVIHENDFRGFGHEFNKEYTTTQVDDSTGHHRIISYRLGGLSFVVRHKTDAYIGDSNPDSATGDNTVAGANAAAEPPKPLSLSPDTPSTDQPSIQSKLTVKREGRAIPPESTIEIRTRAWNKPIEFREIVPTLWVSQTRNLVRAHHKNGIFSRPRVEDATTGVKEWEQFHHEDIKRFVGLINRIIRVTRDWGGSSTVRYKPLKDKLIISKTERKKMLPDDLYARWTRTKPFPSVSRRTFSSMARMSSGRNLLFGRALQTMTRRMPLKVIPL